MVQIFNLSGQIFSTVEHRTLKYEESPEGHIDADRSEWRKLPRPFRNVTTLRVDDGLVKEISHCLQPDVGGLPMELLPKLQGLIHSGSSDTDAFTP